MCPVVQSVMGISASKEVIQHGYAAYPPDRLTCLSSWKRLIQIQADFGLWWGLIQVSSG